MEDAIIAICDENQFNPVLNYLDGLKWDGVKRLDTWISAYLEAADTELNRAIGRKWLIAAVRQVRQPGCKFDFILVLIDEEGTGKSMVFVVLAGEENFSDQTILTLNDRAQQETMEGVWVLEIADLGGMKTAYSELVKAFASRRNHYHR